MTDRTLADLLRLECAKAQRTDSGLDGIEHDDVLPIRARMLADMPDGQRHEVVAHVSVSLPLVLVLKAADAIDEGAKWHWRHDLEKGAMDHWVHALKHGLGVFGAWAKTSAGGKRSKRPSETQRDDKIRSNAAKLLASGTHPRDLAAKLGARHGLSPRQIRRILKNRDI